MMINITRKPSPRSLLSISVATAIAGLLPLGQVHAEGFVLEEITVTAQKRSQSLHDIPMSVNAVSDTALKNAGISTIADIKKLVPSLNIYSAAAPAFASISIRGAGTGASDPTLEPSVGVFVDGVFMPRSVFGLSELVDIDRVEVLMGPQGTLYGKNTNAGVISVHTKGAPDALEAEAEVTAGDYNLRETKLSLGSPITDTLGYRLAAIKRDRDGFIEDELTGKDDKNELDSAAYRAQLFWDPTDQLSVRTIGYYSTQEGSLGDSEKGWNAGSAYYGYLGAISGGAIQPGTDPEDRKSQAQANGGRVEVLGGSVQVDYDLSNGLTLTSISAYQEWEQDGLSQEAAASALTLNLISDRMDEQSYSQEIRLTSPGGETIDWVAGAFWFKSDLHRGSSEDAYSVYPIGLPGVATPAIFGFIGTLLPELIVAGDHATWENKYNTESIAAYGQATWNITDTTSLTAGLRYGEEEKDFKVNVTAYDADGTPFSMANIPVLGNGSYTGGTFIPLAAGSLFTGGPVAIENDRKDDDVTGMISLNHFIGDTMFYATVGTGSKSGGFNGSFGPATADEREFDSEETINYEVGAKMEGLLDGRARVNLAYFYTEYTDFQAATFNPTTVSFEVINAGKQVTQGVDIDATYMATENLTLTAKVEYLDAKYKDFDNATCHALSGGTGCNLDGERMEFAANWAGSLAADYVMPLNNADELYAHVGLSFKSEHYADPTRAPYSKTRYELWDARMGWRNDNWDLSVWGKNLTDDTYTQATAGNATSNLFNINNADGGLSSLNHNRWINEPRTFGLTLRYSL